MFKKAVFPGKYIQGVGAIGEVAALIELLGKQGLVVASPSAKDKVLPSCGLDLKARAIPVEAFGGECCYETLLAYGAAARIASEQHIVTPALDHIVEANTLLSGLGFESAGLASAHSIHNGLTALPETHAFYHGEKVAFGVLAGLQLADAPVEEADTVFSFCEDVGLPTTLGGIGLANVGREKLLKVAEKASAREQPIHHEADLVTPEKVLNAMLAADAIGQARKRGREKDRASLAA